MDLEYRLLQKWGHIVEQFQASNADLKHASVFRQMLAGPGTLWSQASYKKLRQAIGSFSPDIVHVHNTFPRLSPSIFWAAHREGIPVVQTLHNFRNVCANAVLFRDEKPCQDCVGTAGWKALRHRCYANSLIHTAGVVAMNALHWNVGTYTQKVTHFIALSEFSRDVLVRSGLPGEKVVVKPNFVPESKLRRSGRACQVIFVGSMVRHKGVHLLLEAWRGIRRAEAQLLLVGDGPELPELRQKFREVPGIRWMGSLPHEIVLGLIGESRGLVLPTLAYENCPMVLLEAFAGCTPVIVPDLPSMAKFVSHDHQGLLYRAGDTTSLAEMLMAALTASNEVWEHWSRNAGECHRRLYSDTTNYQQLISIYRSAIGSREFAFSGAKQQEQT